MKRESSFFWQNDDVSLSEPLCGGNNSCSSAGGTTTFGSQTSLAYQSDASSTTFLHSEHDVPLPQQEHEREREREEPLNDASRSSTRRTSIVPGRMPYGLAPRSQSTSPTGLPMERLVLSTSSTSIGGTPNNSSHEKLPCYVNNTERCRHNNNANIITQENADVVRENQNNQGPDWLLEDARAHTNEERTSLLLPLAGPSSSPFSSLMVNSPSRSKRYIFPHEYNTIKSSTTDTPGNKRRSPPYPSDVNTNNNNNSHLVQNYGALPSPPLQSTMAREGRQASQSPSSSTILGSPVKRSHRKQLDNTSTDNHDAEAPFTSASTSEHEVPVKTVTASLLGIPVMDTRTTVEQSNLVPSSEPKSPAMSPLSSPEKHKRLSDYCSRQLLRERKPVDKHHHHHRKMMIQNLQKPPMEQSIRFQVVVWHIGKVDIAAATVAMKFRITLFWNVDDPRYIINNNKGQHSDGGGKKSSKASNKNKQLQQQQQRSSFVWCMKGRQRAFLHELSRDETRVEEVDVPPISILNAAHFDMIGSPEVDMMPESVTTPVTSLTSSRRHYSHSSSKAKSSNAGNTKSNTNNTNTKPQQRVMRWTCMYNATLLQQDMRVDNFPHDTHALTLRVGLLAHRRKGQRWDRSCHKLALATERDVQGSTRIPYGLIVDQVHIPDFTICNPDGMLDMDFVPLMYGHQRPASKTHQGTAVGQQGGGETEESHLKSNTEMDADGDQCLRVRITVRRESGHYDTNVMPLMGLLNVVAVSCLCRNFAGSTASTELIMSICFVEIGFRLSIDSRLPSVGYQIKAQRVLNGFFWVLLFLAFETNIVYYLVITRGWSKTDTSTFYNVVWIDIFAATVALFGTARLSLIYYWDIMPRLQAVLSYLGLVVPRKQTTALS
jgi:hypothetical protein